jgi:NAD-dependent SIR2 family protein deacetylase
MSIQVRCMACKKYNEEYKDGSKTNILMINCPYCGESLTMNAVADWLRGINPSMIGD